MEGGRNGPAVVNGGANSYDRVLAFDAPVSFDTGLYEFPNKTLLQLRTDMMIRLGFAAMLAYPPSGMTELLNSFLTEAQELLYFRHSPLRNERWWAWQLSAGRRFYDTPIDGTSALEFRKITGAWISDNGGRALVGWSPSLAVSLGDYCSPVAESALEFKATIAKAPGSPDPDTLTGTTEPAWPTVVGGTVIDGMVTWTAVESAAATWSKLVPGICPLDYSTPDRGQPYYFDVRQYLEVWPVPDKTYVVWLRGHLGLKKFTADTDTATIDARAIFLLALANAKAHYGQPDANNYVRQLEVFLGTLVGATHGTNRYIPNPRPLMAGSWPDQPPVSMPRATFR